MATIESEAVTIVETPVTIETIEEAIRDSEPPTPDPARKPVTIDTGDETTTKKKPGRPVGSKSKVPGKPRAPRKVKISEVEVEAVEPPPRELPLQGSIPIPTISHDARSAMMLSLLAEQARTRQTHKADLWKSWFR